MNSTRHTWCAYHITPVLLRKDTRKDIRAIGPSLSKTHSKKLLSYELCGDGKDAPFPREPTVKWQGRLTQEQV